VGAGGGRALLKYRVVVEGRPYVIEIRDDCSVWIDGVRREADLSEASGQPFHSLLLDGQSYETQLRAGDEGYLEIVVKGRKYRTHLSASASSADGIAEKPDPGSPSASGSQAWVTAPLPGLLVETRVSNGDRVQEGDVVVVLESMKMHLELRAPRAGVVRSLEAIPGQEVDLDEVLAIIA
jgi:biotin carboxyl carrier protein